MLNISRRINWILLPVLAMTEVAMADEETNLGQLLVEGNHLSTDIVNSIKMPTPLIEVPQSVSVISNQQIELQSFKSIGDVLRYTPGVSISQGEGHRDAIVIRGYRSTSDFFIDGIRDDVQYYRPLYNVEQIEIMRGANALLFGRGGSGGVLNRVTKQPKIDEQFSSVQASIDTFADHSVTGDTNMIINDNMALRLNAYYRGHNNHRDFFDGDSFAFNPTLKMQLTPVTTVLFSYEHVNDDRVIDRGVPSVAGSTPRVPLEGYQDTFFGSPTANVTTLQANLFKTRLEHVFSNALTGDITIMYADYDKLYQNLYASESAELNNGQLEEIELDGYRDPTERENIILQANLANKFSTSFIDHTLLVGAEYAKQDTNNLRYNIVFADNNDDQITFPFTDPLNIPAFAFTDLARQHESNVEVASFYVRNQADLTEKFKLILGFRYDRFDIDVTDEMNNEHFSRTDNEISPRIGGLYQPMDDLSLYASYSKTFQPASGDQFLRLNAQSENTEPQSVDNYEVGLKWDIRPNLSLTTAIFQLKRENYTTPDPGDPSALPITIAGSEINGVEIQMTGQLMDNVFVNTGYSYFDSEINYPGNATDGNEPRETPNHMFSVWGHYQANQKLSVALGAVYNSSYFASDDNSVRVPGYTRIDAAAYYNLTSTLRLQLNIENLLDKEYFPNSHSNTNITTGKPLNANFTIVKQF